MSGGCFEVLAASEDEQKLAQQQAGDRLAAAVYDVRQEFGDFLFKAANIQEFRTRVALVKDDMMKVVDRHLPPVSGVMGRIAVRRGSILERQFKAFKKGAPFADYDNFADCTSKNSDKDNPDAYCGEIKHRTEDKTSARRLEATHSIVADDPHLGWFAVADATSGAGEYVNDMEGQLSGGSAMPPSPLTSGDPTGGMLGDTVVPGNIPGNPGIEGDKPTMPGGLKSWGRRRHWATGEGGALSTDETYHPESGALIPEGDWHGFQDSVDQGAESKVDDAFASGEHDKHYDGDPSNTDFVSGHEAAWVGPDQHSYVGKPKGQDAEDWGNWEEHLKSRSADPRNREHPLVQDARDSHDRAIGARRRQAVDDDNNGIYNVMQGQGFGPEHETGGFDEAFPSKMGALTLRYLSFCHRNNLAPTLASLERHGKRLDPGEYLALANGLDKLARLPRSEKVKVARLVDWTLRQAETYHGEGDVEDKSGPFAGPHGSFPVGTESDLSGAKDVCNMPSVHGKHPGTCDRIEHMQKPAARRRRAAPDYLMKAKDALEGLLNQKAEEFQTGVAPLQQALQVVQQSQAIEQANNPLSVQPPAGTVNVLPDPPQGMPGAPAAGGGAPADQNAPPPAADAAGLSGMPPDPTQQMAASRRRGGHPKGRVPA
jgi:hypothetical protein